MIDWNIQSRAHGCQVCHEPFQDKQPFHTLLFDRKQGYERLDICEHCWKHHGTQSDSERKGFISHWHGIFVVPPAAPPEAIQKDTAETLLRKLVERNDPKHCGARFILAVMLERKRLLKVKAQLFEDGQRIFIYEQGKTGDLFRIVDPNLQLTQLEAVQQDVASLLEHGPEPLPGGDVQPNATPAALEPSTGVTDSSGPAESVEAEQSAAQIPAVS